MSKGIIPRLELQPEGKATQAESHSLAELLTYHDKAFVENVYRVLTRRVPDSKEVSQTLADLRNGKLTKIEIIETLANSEPGQTQITGMPSRAMRNIANWPIIGYLVRVVRGVTKIPVLMRDQQRFEAYSLAQQQRIADYINENLVPLLSSDSTGARLEPNSNLADTIESVLMLSDSMIELSERQYSIEQGLQSVQTQLEKSEGQLHANLVALTETIKSLQVQLSSLNDQVKESVSSPKDFLIQEQALIVEAQKLALKDLEVRLNLTIRADLEALRVAVEQLRAEIGPATPSLSNVATAERDQA